jgi:hypothetical protein
VVQFLTDHITREVASFTGVRKKIPWLSVALAVVIGAPLGYWTYRLNVDGFDWVSLIPGAIAGFMLIAVLGMLFGSEESSRDSG